LTENLDQAPAAKAHRANDLFERHGCVLREDRTVSSLLDVFCRAIENTGKAMIKAGVAASCTACAAKGPGSCCFPEIEENYDEIMLLINMLLGCRLPETHEVSNSCFFVGAKGCKLKAKYYFCIHYFCPQLQESLGSAGIEALLKVIGKELSAGWELERAIRQLGLS
jgi:hypothetical protein